jgi:type IV pilus assembly protein PilV
MKTGVMNIEVPMQPNSTPRSRRGARASAGFSLIEVMISVLVLALGMLGIAALQATALRNSQNAFERSQGVMQTYSILDAMRANRPAAIIGQYDLPSWTCEPPDPDSLAMSDLGDWISSMQASLSASACGKIECSSENCLIEVRWDERGTGDEPAVQEYTVQTRTRL